MNWRYLAQITVAYFAGAINVAGMHFHHPLLGLGLTVLIMMSLPWWRKGKNVLEINFR